MKNRLSLLVDLIKNAQQEPGTLVPPSSRPATTPTPAPASTTHGATSGSPGTLSPPSTAIQSKQTSVPSYSGGKSQSDPKAIPIPKNNIATMQRAILDFKKLLQSSETSSMDARLSPQGKGRGQIIPGTDTNARTGEQTTDAEEDLGGLEPFGNAFMKGWFNPSKTKGHQYADVDLTVEEGREENGIGSIDAQNIRGLVQTLGHIGTPSKEEQDSAQSNKPIKPSGVVGIFYDSHGNKVNEQGQRLDKNNKPIKGTFGGEGVPDGKWDVRTNNALKNIAGLMSAFLNFAKDMKKTIPNYSNSELSQFKNGIPNNPEVIDQETKNRVATFMTQNIVKMQEFYKAFKSQILDNQKYKSFVSQQNAFTAIKMDKDKAKPTPARDWILKDDKESKENGYAASVRAYYDAHKTQSPNTKFFGIAITYGDIGMKFNYSQLSDVNSFKARVKEYLRKDPSVEELRSVFDTVKMTMQSNQSSAYDKAIQHGQQIAKEDATLREEDVRKQNEQGIITYRK